MSHKLLILAATAGLAVLGSPASLHAASFDCALARSSLEKAICADPSLSQADQLMARVYRAQLAAAPAGFRERLRDSQRSWLTYIGPFCSVPANRRLECLRRGFKERTEELGQTTRRVGPLIFFQAASYQAVLDPDHPDRAFSHKIEFLQIASPQSRAYGRWNNLAIDKLKGPEGLKSPDDSKGPADADEEDDDDRDDLETVALLSGASADLVSARFGISHYSGGMAHGEYSSHAVVWSLRLGRALTLADLFENVSAGKDRLARQAKVHFEGNDPESVTSAAIRDSLDDDGVWEATPAGVLLRYNPYAFGCYPCTGSALVPWAELRPYLRADLPFDIEDLRD